jgi:D-alanyl-D-alanine carboxypeptidase
MLKPTLLAVTLGLALVVSVSLPVSIDPVSSASSAPVSTSQLKQQVRARLDEFQRTNGFPGATMAVVLPDGTEFAVAAGLSDSDKNTAMRANDRMLAGSIGKTFFATIFLRMISAGQMHLDDKISIWLKDEPWFHHLPNANDITVRMLMNHTSGIPEYAELPTFSKDLAANPDKDWPPEELLSYIFDKPAPFPAGQGWSYADANYLVLGIAAEKILHHRLYDDIDRTILKPLKLENTRPSTARVLPGLITGYSMPNSPFPVAGAMLRNGKLLFNPKFEWTGGGFLSNSSDLARWAFDLYGGKVLSAGELKQMEAGVPAKTDKNDEYGLGVQIRHTDFGVTYGHGGWFPGYLSEMEYFPEYHVAIAMQINTDDFAKTKGIPHRYIVELARTILPEIGKRSEQ